MSGLIFFFFFFQAEDGIRDLTVTGVQTCALPIYRRQAKASGVDRRRSARTRAAQGDRGSRAGPPALDLAAFRGPVEPDLGGPGSTRKADPVFTHPGAT